MKASALDRNIYHTFGRKFSWQPGHFLFFRHLEVLLNNILNLTKSSFFNKLLSVLLDSLLPQSDRILCHRRYDHPSAGTKNNRTPRNRKSIAGISRRHDGLRQQSHINSGRVIEVNQDALDYWFEAHISRFTLIFLMVIWPCCKITVIRHISTIRLTPPHPPPLFPIPLRKSLSIRGLYNFINIATDLFFWIVMTNLLKSFVSFSLVIIRREKAWYWEKWNLPRLHVYTRGLPLLARDYSIIGE